MNELKEIAVKYRRELNPVMEMLVHNRYSMPHQQWHEFVKRTEQSIIKNPDQYLFGISERTLNESIVQELFNEFIKSMNGR